MRKKSKLIVTLALCITLLCSLSAPVLATDPMNIDQFIASPSGDIQYGQYKAFLAQVSGGSGEYSYRFVAWDGQQVYWLTDWQSSNYYSFQPLTRGDWEVDVLVQDVNIPSYSLYADHYFTVH